MKHTHCRRPAPPAPMPSPAELFLLSCSCGAFTSTWAWQEEGRVGGALIHCVCLPKGSHKAHNGPCIMRRRREGIDEASIRKFTQPSQFSSQASSYASHFALNAFLHYISALIAFKARRATFCLIDPLCTAWVGHEFHETCHSVTFYFMKKDSKRCCDTTMPESIHTKDESKCGSAFAFILVWIDQYNECNGMTSFMEFVICCNWSFIIYSQDSPTLQNVNIQTDIFQCQGKRWSAKASLC